MWHMPCELYGRSTILQVCEVLGGCPVLISGESMRALGVTLRLSGQKIDVLKLEVYDQELQYDGRSGHAIVSLLPTTPYGATKANAPVVRAGRRGRPRDGRRRYRGRVSLRLGLGRGLFDVDGGQEGRAEAAEASRGDGSRRWQDGCLAARRDEASLEGLGGVHLDHDDSCHGVRPRLGGIGTGDNRVRLRPAPEGGPPTSASLHLSRTARCGGGSMALTIFLAVPPVAAVPGRRLLAGFGGSPTRAHPARDVLAAGGAPSAARRAGRRFMGEKPWRSAAWDTEPGRWMVQNMAVAEVDTCAFGVRDPVEHLYYQKKTKLVVSDLAVAAMLPKRWCGGHVHRRMRHSEFAGGYTELFGRRQEEDRDVPQGGGSTMFAYRTYYRCQDRRQRSTYYRRHDRQQRSTYYRRHDRRQRLTYGRRHDRRQRPTHHRRQRSTDYRRRETYYRRSNRR